MLRTPPLAAALLLTFCFGPLACAAAPDTSREDGVEVTKRPVKLETRRFDPKRPPSDMPKLQAGEAALAVAQFQCEAQMSVSVIEPPGGEKREGDEGKPCRAVVKVESVGVALGCTVTIWLPTNATEKIIRHENGHRRISEIFYEDADRVARELAQRYVGRTLTGEAKDCPAASRAAMTDALNHLNGDYMDAVYTPSQRAQAKFDEITDHGRNKIEEDEAIRRAVDNK